MPRPPPHLHTPDASLAAFVGIHPGVFEAGADGADDDSVAAEGGSLGGHYAGYVPNLIWSARGLGDDCKYRDAVAVAKEGGTKGCGGDRCTEGDSAIFLVEAARDTCLKLSVCALFTAAVDGSNDAHHFMAQIIILTCDEILSRGASTAVRVRAPRVASLEKQQP